MSEVFVTAPTTKHKILSADYCSSYQSKSAHEWHVLPLIPISRHEVHRVCTCTHATTVIV